MHPHHTIIPILNHLNRMAILLLRLDALSFVRWRLSSIRNMKHQTSVDEVIVIDRLWSNDSNLGDGLVTKLSLMLHQEVRKRSSVGRSCDCQSFTKGGAEMSGAYQATRGLHQYRSRNLCQAILSIPPLCFSSKTR
jgi:hypothetical protein